MACCEPFAGITASACTPNNCETSKRIAFSGKFNLLPTANGFVLQQDAQSDGAGGAGTGQRGDHLELKPFGNRRMRVLGIQITGQIDDGTGTIVDAASIVGIGTVEHNSKEVRPTMDASFKDYVTCGETTDPDTYLKNGINVLNPSCLPVFGNNDPLLIGLAGNGNALDGVCITVEVEYV